MNTPKEPETPKKMSLMLFMLLLGVMLAAILIEKGIVYLESFFK
jgi:LPS O-antigen subunit length determinant protein (WzzB/FepE family)